MVLSKLFRRKPILKSLAFAMILLLSLAQVGTVFADTDAGAAVQQSPQTESVAPPSAQWNTVSSAVYDVRLAGPSTIRVGEPATVSVSVYWQNQPVANPQGVTFTSSNEQVIKVNAATGRMEARNPGQAVINAAYQGSIGSLTVQATPSDAVPVNDRILSKSTSTRTLELEGRGIVQLTEFYTVVQQINGATVTKSLSDVMVGARNVSFLFNLSGNVYGIVLDGETPFDVMRVGIRKNIDNIADNTQFDHQQIDLTSTGGLTILDKKANQTVQAPAGALVSFKPAGGQIVVLQGTAELYRTANRLYVQAAAPGTLMKAMSFKRAYGNPLYRGSFEISLNTSQTTLKLINEVNMEQYLYQVVPSEMPASFGLEALRAQAVAARTYALSDYVSNRFADRGFHIDDSTLSQVYNNSAEAPLTTQAVNDTAGLVMKSGGEIVDARFYSTSGGFGASKHEVWSDTGTNAFPGTPIPYLIARSYTYDPANPGKMLQLNTHDEAQLNAFYKNVSLTGYDSESYYFRWKVALTKTELENTINANLSGRQAADPQFVLTKQPDGTFVSKPIPAAGVGSLLNLYVTKRGEGGNMMELVVEGTNGTYKILKEYNIRFTIRPSKTYTKGADVILQRAKGGSSDYDPAFKVLNPSILTSAFATFDIARDAAGQMTGVTFYGGGNGHGVGMSQYGASMLGGKGWSYEQILTSYYANMQIVKLNGTFTTLQSIRVEGVGALNVGDTKNPAVIAAYSDGSELQLTAGVVWTSSRASVATVGADGTVTARGKGTAEITASYGGKTASATVTVSGAAALERIAVDITPQTLWVGDRAQASVTAFYSDDSTAPVSEGVTYAVSDPALGSIDADGAVTALAPGDLTITAVYGGFEASATAKVLPVPAVQSIAVNGSGILREGEAEQLTVTASFADGSTRVVSKGVQFGSEREKMATVSETGLVQAVKTGSTVITVSYEGQSVSYQLNIRPDDIPGHK